MLKLKLQYFGHLMVGADSLEKTLMLGRTEGRRRRGRQRMRWLDGMGLGGFQELVIDREAWRAAVHGVAKSRTRLSDWTELNTFRTRVAPEILLNGGKQTLEEGNVAVIIKSYKLHGPEKTWYIWWMQIAVTKFAHGDRRVEDTGKVDKVQLMKACYVWEFWTFII